ncbi:RNA polymerase sigma-70 factor [Sphingobacterium olei]|uniref:RNA polymerase sigma-70 factor n=1 Tax=Sphingobacterium olei TaxID=2571155 RepID=A0A4U0NYR8_9SPHI|nr:RNA polymerase sigma-70 factor [Sphingobacterium olei]TJZ60021.1 RNA polymerase sigma-70 factor [Sphingobacterium olei]
MNNTPAYRVSRALANEELLLAQIAKGDVKAFGLVYDHYYSRIYTFVLRLMKSDVLAEEVTQETFLKFWRQGYKLKNVKSLEGFLVTISRNRTLDLLRKAKLEIKAARHYHEDWSEANNETEESLILKETQQIIQEAIELLPRQQKQVYELCHQEGLKYEEVAKRLNLSVLTVQSYMKLALKNLRKQLANRTDLMVLLTIFKLF